MKSQRANRNRVLLVKTDIRRGSVYQSYALDALFKVKDPDKFK